MMTTKPIPLLRAAAVALALAFLTVPAAPLGGIVPIPTVGGSALADNASCYTPMNVSLVGPNYAVTAYVASDGTCDPDPGNAPDPVPMPQSCTGGALTAGLAGSALAKAGGNTVIGWVGWAVMAGAGAYMAMGGCDD